MFETFLSRFRASAFPFSVVQERWCSVHAAGGIVPAFTKPSRR